MTEGDVQILEGVFPMQAPEDHRAMGMGFDETSPANDVGFKEERRILDRIFGAAHKIKSEGAKIVSKADDILSTPGAMARIVAARGFNFMAKAVGENTALEREPSPLDGLLKGVKEEIADAIDHTGAKIGLPGVALLAEPDESLTEELGTKLGYLLKSSPLTVGHLLLESERASTLASIIELIAKGQNCKPEDFQRDPGLLSAFAVVLSSTFQQLGIVFSKNAAIDLILQSSPALAEAEEKN